MAADSGQLSADNAGRVAKDPLSDAISAALDAPTEAPAKEPVVEEKAEAKGPDAESAGDERDGEDAAKVAEPSKLTDAKDDKSPSDGKSSLDAPKHWAEPDKAVFAGLPEDAKRSVLKLAKNLEGGFTRKSQELSDKARFADGIRGLFDDNAKQQMVRAGLDEAGMIRYLVGVQRFATERPAEYIKWAMQNLGVAPEQLQLPQTSKPAVANAETSDDQLAALLVDPAVKSLEAKLAAMESKFAEKERQEQEYQNQQRVSSAQTITNQISEFRSALDDHGQLMYPHFDVVQRHMGALMDTDPDLAAMQDGQAKLAQAYEMAVYARPDLRSSFIEAEVARRSQEQEKRLAAEKAKRATAVKPAVGVVTSKSKASNLDDAIASSMSKLGL